jgi:serine protease 16
VFGAISSSGPVEAQLNFEGYNIVVGNSLGAPIVGGSPACVSAVQAAFQALNNLTAAPSQLPMLQDRFNTCTPLVNASNLDLLNFIGTVAGNFQGVVQYNNLYPTRFLNVSQVCQIMLQPATDAVSNLANFTLQANKGECLDFSWADVIAGLSNTTADPASNERQWYWQTCTEFGYYQTCDANTTCPFKSPAALDLSLQVGLCTQVYGVEPATTAARIAFSNQYYGGNQPAGDRIVYVNGSIDPWHWLSVLASIPGSDQSAIYIPGTAHCANMHASQPSDPEPLKQARVQIQNTISSWLQLARQQQAVA